MFALEDVVVAGSTLGEMVLLSEQGSSLLSILQNLRLYPKKYPDVNQYEEACIEHSRNFVPLIYLIVCIIKTKRHTLPRGGLRVFFRLPSGIGGTSG